MEGLIFYTMKHLKYFNTNDEYASFIESEDLVLPNVSYAADITKVYFNPSEVITSDFSVDVNLLPKQFIAYENYSNAYNVLSSLTYKGKSVNKIYLGEDDYAGDLPFSLFIEPYVEFEDFSTETFSTEDPFYQWMKNVELKVYESEYQYSGIYMMEIDSTWIKPYFGNISELEPGSVFDYADVAPSSCVLYSNGHFSPGWD